MWQEYERKGKAYGKPDRVGTSHGSSISWENYSSDGSPVTVSLIIRILICPSYLLRFEISHLVSTACAFDNFGTPRGTASGQVGRATELRDSVTHTFHRSARL